jgi:2,4-diketo-3-deoxy-L-fuconate hydrolase
MRIANNFGRLALVEGNLALDVESASSGHFSSDPQAIYSQWPAFLEWARSQDVQAAGSPFNMASFGPCTPRPPQVFAIALNYGKHAGESGFDVPDNPVVFTKWPSSLTGPDADVVLTGNRVDWEAELVVVVGVGGRDIAKADAWAHIAGLTVGQDLSDRTVQFWGAPPQFSLGKSLAGFAPIGPWIVTVDEIRSGSNPDNLSIECILTDENGAKRVLQSGRSGDMIFTIPDLISRLSSLVELYPGDIIFTGTPDGVGIGREPQEFLKAGQTLTTTIEGIGSITQRCR